MRDPARWLKPLFFTVSLLPLLVLLFRALFSDLGVNPVETLHHTLGDWTLRFLIITLLITPLRLIPGWNWLSKMRRMMGLYAFFYATLHLIVYLAIDQQFDWSAIDDDITHHPYITLGMSAYVLLIPLAITSNHTMINRLGNYWKKLHRMIYLITALGILHFYLLVKADTREPLFYAGLFCVLLILRLLLAGRKVT